MAKKYKCPYCQERLIRKELIDHIDKEHEELIPEGFESAQVVYDLVNGTKGAGRCRVCSAPTKWNSSAKRYDVLCGNPKCKQKMREEYQKNMIRVHGTYNILTDDEQQKKMLANRSISGKYKFTDGGIVTYTGSYEKKFLEFADKVMMIPSKDIMAPGPTLEYEMNGEKHFYITDFLYIPYNLIIEVKDGGSNPNNKDSKGMRSSRQRTIEKEKLITDRGEFNYLRLTDNQFVQLLEIFMEIKKAMIEGDTDKIIKINESFGRNSYYKKEIKFDKNHLSIPMYVRNYNIKNKTPINNMTDLLKYHKNPGLIDYVNNCNDINTLKYIKTDTYTCISTISKIKERISLCKELGNCGKTSSYYKFIKENYIDAGITEKDCDATINWVKSFCKSITDKVHKLEKVNESFITENVKKDCPYDKCIKCGSNNIGVYIEGEPVYKCNDCGQFLGVVPFSSKNEAVTVFPSGWFAEYREDGERRLKELQDEESTISESKFDQDLTKFGAYHLEPAIKPKNKIYGGWDEELYSKSIEFAINNDIKYNYKLKERDEVSAYVYTAGKDLKAIYLGTITIFDKNNPNDWEWEEQELLDKKTYDYLKKHPMVEAADISNFYEDDDYE